MNQTVTYEWTEALGRDGLKTFYESKVASFWFITAAGLALLVIGGVSFTFNTRNPLELGIAGMGLFFLCFSIKHRFTIRRLVKDARLLMNDPIVTVLLADDGLTISSDKNTRTTDWGNVTTILDRKDFLLVYCGVYLVACLPKKYFTDEQCDFVKSHVR